MNKTRKPHTAFYHINVDDGGGGNGAANQKNTHTHTYAVVVVNSHSFVSFRQQNMPNVCARVCVRFLRLARTAAVMCVCVRERERNGEQKWKIAKQFGSHLCCDYVVAAPNECHLLGNLFRQPDTPPFDTVDVERNGMMRWALLRRVRVVHGSHTSNGIWCVLHHFTCPTTAAGARWMHYAVCTGKRTNMFRQGRIGSTDWVNLKTRSPVWCSFASATNELQPNETDSVSQKLYSRTPDRMSVSVRWVLLWWFAYVVWQLRQSKRSSCVAYAIATRIFYARNEQIGTIRAMLFSVVSRTQNSSMAVSCKCDWDHFLGINFIIST